MISRFVGITENNLNILKEMSVKMAKSGKNKEVTYTDNNVNLEIRYLNEEYKIKYFINESNYIIIFLDGNIYNKEELLNLINAYDSNFSNSKNIIEIIAKLYILFKEKFLNYLRGNYSLCIYEFENNRILLAKDHLGTKPLYYSLVNNVLIFANEIKALLKYDKSLHIVDHNGICSILNLNIINIPGKTIYKNIYEVKAGSYIIYEDNKLTEFEYFSLDNYDHTDNLEDTYKKINYYMNYNIIEETEYLNLNNKKIKKLNYINNNLNIYGKLYQLLLINDKPMIINNPLLYLLEGKIDSKNNILLDINLIDILKSENNINNCLSLDIKEVYLSSNLKDILNKKDYLIMFKEKLKIDNKNIYRSNFSLKLNYIINNLIFQSEQLSNDRLFEVFTPFIEYKLVNYLYNIPSKLFNNLEFNNINSCSKNNLNYSYNYNKMLKNKILDILDNPNNNIKEIFDINYLKNIINNNIKYKNIDNNAFIEYLIQLELWIKEYSIIFEL